MTPSAVKIVNDQIVHQRSIFLHFHFELGGGWNVSGRGGSMEIESGGEGREKKEKKEEETGWRSFIKLSRTTPHGATC